MNVTWMLLPHVKLRSSHSMRQHIIACIIGKNSFSQSLGTVNQAWPFAYLVFNPASFPFCLGKLLSCSIGIVCKSLVKLSRRINSHSVVMKILNFLSFLGSCKGQQLVYYFCGNQLSCRFWIRIRNIHVIQLIGEKI